jgi:hypothetical protein
VYFQIACLQLTNSAVLYNLLLMPSIKFLILMHYFSAQEFLFGFKKLLSPQLGVVFYACNLSYLGGGDQKN